MTRYIHPVRIAAVGGLATAAALALSATPAMATRVCPPGTTNPIYCVNVLPIGTTSAASAVGNTKATLNGAAGPGVPNGDATTYVFQYGTTTSYGTQTPAGTVASGTASQFVSANISGLSPNTMYHFRIISSNADGTTVGQDQTFSTTSTPPPPVTPPIQFCHAPSSVKHLKKFQVTCKLRVGATVVFRFAGQTITTLRAPGTFHVRLKAPGKKGTYTLRVTAVGGHTKMSVSQKIRVF